MDNAEAEIEANLNATEAAIKRSLLHQLLGDGVTKRAPGKLDTRAGPELLVNGGFETGDFTGWTLTVNPLTNFLVGVTFIPWAVYEGNYAAYFGTIFFPVTLSQTIQTVPGQTYTFSYALANVSPAQFNHFDAYFGTQEVEDITFAPSFPYTLRSWSVTATSTTTDVHFRFRNFAAFWLLDAVSVRVTVTPTE